MVVEWINSTKLDFLGNIVKYSKIDGKTLLYATDGFYENTLGISDETHTYLLKHLVDSMKESAITEVVLYGWGANDYGQLGIFG